MNVTASSCGPAVAAKRTAGMGGSGRGWPGAGRGGAWSVKRRRRTPSSRTSSCSGFRRRAHAAPDRVLRVDAHDVLAVDREVVADHGAAARPERERLAGARRLGIHAGHAVAPDAGADVEIADRQPRDAGGGRQVALEEPRRQPLHVGVVVEAEGHVVGRQQRVPVHLDRQQIADRVRVLRPIEAAHGRPPRVRRRLRRPVDGRLQPRRERRVGCGVGARPRGRRHRLGPQLDEHLLPRRRVRAHVVQISGLQREVRDARAVVVAGQAVAVEYGAEGRGGRSFGGRFLNGGGRGCRRRRTGSGRWRRAEDGSPREQHRGGGQTDRRELRCHPGRSAPSRPQQALVSESSDRNASAYAPPSDVSIESGGAR